MLIIPIFVIIAFPIKKKKIKVSCNVMKLYTTTSNNSYNDYLLINFLKIRVYNCKN